MQSLAAFMRHPIVQGILYAITVAVVGAICNWVTWKRTPEEWAAYRTAHPRLATLILVMRVMLPHMRKIPAIMRFIPPEEAKPIPPGSVVTAQVTSAPALSEAVRAAEETKEPKS